MEYILTLVLLNQDLFFFQNTVDSDQLAYVKPSEKDPHCCSQIMYFLVNASPPEQLDIAASNFAST